MYLLLSGEGPGDMGACNPSSHACNRDGFAEGPMAIIVDQLVESHIGQLQGFDMSHLDTEQVSYVSEGYLANNRQAPMRKAMALKGKKKPPETKYFYENARALAQAAKLLSQQINDEVIAVLFRDSDGNASAGRGDWVDKRQSIKEGFEAEMFDFGIAMVPKPKSEAWLLCATKEVPYQHCDGLENESGNDSVDNSLKNQLSDSLSGHSATPQINNLLRNKTIDVFQIEMNSFSCFKCELEAAVTRCIQGSES